MRRRLGGAHRVQCFGNRCVAGHAHEVRAHQPAGAVRIVVEQRANLGLLGRRQQREHGRAPLLFELGDEVGSVVGRHARQHAGHFRVGSRTQELELMLGVELFEHVGLQLGVGVHGGDDLLALRV